MSQDRDMCCICGTDSSHALMTCITIDSEYFFIHAVCKKHFVEGLKV